MSHRLTSSACARTRGRKAFHAGIQLSECPEAACTNERSEWRAGWLGENKLAEVKDLNLSNPSAVGFK